MVFGGYGELEIKSTSMEWCKFWRYHGFDMILNYCNRHNWLLIILLKDSHREMHFETILGILLNQKIIKIYTCLNILNLLALIRQLKFPKIKDKLRIRILLVKYCRSPKHDCTVSFSVPMKTHQKIRFALSIRCSYTRSSGGPSGFCQNSA